MKSVLATLLLLSSIGAQASSGQALRGYLTEIAKIEKLKQRSTITAQLCGETENQEYTLFTNRKGEIFAVAQYEGLYSSTGEEGVFGIDRAELLNLESCEIKVIKLSN